MLLQAMEDSDQLVVEFNYRDQDNVETKRIVSPMKFVSETDFLALCLSREEPRRFNIDRCSDMALDEAHKYVMPVKKTHGV